MVQGSGLTGLAFNDKVNVSTITKKETYLMTNISRIPPNDEPDWDKGFVSSGSYQWKPKREADPDVAYDDYRIEQDEKASPKDN